MPNIRTLFLENKAWVQEKLQTDPNYFSDTSLGQQPAYLWIGCSDSRVLPNEITGTTVGELFTHRNIANLVHANDLNLMSVVSYALQYLKIKEVVICGHYGCGGVSSASSKDSFGLLDEWLKNIKTVERNHQAELDQLPAQERLDRLVELNVLAQVKHLKDSDVVQKLMKDNPEIRIHGWVYDMRSGYIKNLNPP